MRKTDEKIDDLVAQLAQDAATTKSVSHPFILSLQWIGLAIIYLAISLLISGVRPDVMEKLHEPWFAAEIIALLGILISTSLSTALLGFPDLHQKRYLTFMPIGIFIVFVLILLAAWYALPFIPISTPQHGIACSLCIIAMAMLPAAWMFYVMRKYASIHVGWAGSVALLSSFSIGALWLRLHEVNDSILHVIQWHYLPMLVVGMIGLWMGKRLLKW